MGENLWLSMSMFVNVYFKAVFNLILVMELWLVGGDWNHGILW
jgi:hypothetical protein